MVLRLIASNEKRTAYLSQEDIQSEESQQHIREFLVFRGLIHKKVDLCRLTTFSVH